MPASKGYLSKAPPGYEMASSGLYFDKIEPVDVVGRYFRDFLRYYATMLASAKIYPIAPKRESYSSDKGLGKIVERLYGSAISDKPNCASCKGSRGCAGCMLRNKTY